MARRYHLCPLPGSGTIDLAAEVSHHLARVMRVRVGDPLVLFDGQGRECDARVVAVTGAGRQPAVRAEVGPPRAAGGEPAVQLHVVCAAPKGTRGDWLFEHGTEIGITVFHPVVTERVAGTARPDRWRRIVAAATGQCDRGRIPTVHDCRPLAEVLTDPGLPTERYLADPAGPPLAAARTTTAVLLVGPPGGLTAAERELAVAHGFQPHGLGATTLRTETAVLAGAVLLLQAPLPGSR